MISIVTFNLFVIKQCDTLLTPLSHLAQKKFFTEAFVRRQNSVVFTVAYERELTLKPFSSILRVESETG